MRLAKYILLVFDLNEYDKIIEVIVVFYFIGIIYAIFMIYVGIYEISQESGESHAVFYQMLLIFSGSIIVVAFIWSLLYRINSAKK
ncbi:hypothetical protein AXW59_10980 [Yersinia ruckeri]|nr:hypothetical protein NJ56_17440 [Yersinia ruckeri]OJB82269.1 hypothetical protein A9Q60_10640 [Yersinia ruckeri]OJB83028.1 hypothetical protein A9Q62_11010 [Yersinia ruckeri]OJB99335.1 hypothetical protein AXW59_10980 [Yersinia ruckeri]OJC02198.1 hypothetical protein AXW58_10950 [Yersinia ruckeri]